MLSIMSYHPFSGMTLPLVFTAWTSMLFWNVLGTVLVVVAGASHVLAFTRELQRMMRWNGSRSNMKESSLTNPKISDLRSFPGFFKFKFWQVVNLWRGFMYLELYFSSRISWIGRESEILCIFVFLFRCFCFYQYNVRLCRYHASSIPCQNQCGFFCP